MRRTDRRGAGRGYRLPKTFEIPPLMFERHEIEALVVGARFVEAWCGPGLAASARSALARIRGVVPPDLLNQVDDARVYTLRFGRGDEHFDVVHRAIGAHRRLVIDYAGEDGQATPIASFARWACTSGARFGRWPHGASCATTFAASASTASTVRAWPTNSTRSRRRRSKSSWRVIVSKTTPDMFLAGRVERGVPTGRTHPTTPWASSSTERSMTTLPSLSQETGPYLRPLFAVSLYLSG